MAESPEYNIYEWTFSPTEKTDAILVVQDTKLHVNKGLLSCHSDYFAALFNSNFKEKSMNEIPIEDVGLEDFAVLLSLVHPRPLSLRDRNLENLLELAERFLLPGATNYIEMYLLASGLQQARKLILADRFQLDKLLTQALRMFQKKSDVYFVSIFAGFSERTKARFFDRLMQINPHMNHILERYEGGGAKRHRMDSDNA